MSLVVSVVGRMVGLLVALLLLCSGVAAQVNLELSMEGPATAVVTGTSFRIGLNYRCASVSVGARSSKIEVVLPAGVNFLSYETSPHVASASYNPGSRKLIFTMIDPLGAGTSGQVAFTAELQNGSTANGTVRNFPGTFSASNATNVSTSLNVTASAQARLTVEKYCPAKTALNSEVYYNMNVCNGVDGVVTPGSLDLSNIVATDVLPPGATFVRFYNSTGSVSANYNSSTRTATLNLPPLGPGECAWLGMVVTYASPSTSIGNYKTNTLNVSAKPVGTGTIYGSKSTTHQIVANEAESTVIKEVYPVYVRAGHTSNFHISFANTGTESLANAQLIDNIPADIEVYGVALGKWMKPGTTDVNFLHFQYKTNLNNWRSWGPTNRNAIAGDWFDAAALGLTNGSGEYITAIRWNFGTAPAGFWCYERPTIWFVVRPNTPDKQITNCATGASTTAATHITGCATLNAMAAQVVAYQGPNAWIAPGQPNPYNVGDVITIHHKFHNFPSSLLSLTNLSGSMVLPAGLEPIAGSSIVTGNSSSLAAPTVNVANDYHGSGLKRITWTWPSSNSTLHIGKEITVAQSYLITTSLAAGLPAATLQFIQHSTTTAKLCYAEEPIDTYDQNNNGSVTDRLCGHSMLLNVANYVAMSSELSVKGSLDASYSTYPATGSTLPGGLADYQLTLRNEGNTAMDRIVSLDLLPQLGDVGVIDLTARDSRWRPNLAGPVLAPAGVTVFYSTANNICRAAEGFLNTDPPGCQPPAWTAVPPADITAVNAIKIDFGSRRLEAGEALTFNWPMRTPTNVLSQPGVSAGSIAWNSAAFTAYRAGTSTRLLATEPIKTGIAIAPLAPGVVGDRIWSDTNGNGLQDAGEVGINNVRVELYRDNGDGIADVGADTYVAFTVTAGDGTYLFPALPTGNYFVLFAKPPTYTLSPPLVGADRATDSDGTLYYANGETAAITAVFAVTNTQYDFTRDLGLQPSGKTAIGNYVWNDLDGNGIQNEGPAAGVNGVTVKLLTSAGALITTTRTRPNLYGYPGYYVFDDLTPGTYRVAIDIPGGTTLSAARRGTDTAADSDGDPSTGMCPNVSLAANVPNLTFDFALQLGSTEICDNGIDDDGNGSVDCEDGACATSTLCAPRFACDNKLYQTIKIGSNYWLYRVDVYPSVALVPLVNLTAKGVVGDVNSTILNPKDGYMYVLENDAPYRVYRITGDLNVVYLGMATVPTGVVGFNAGAVDQNARWLLREYINGNFYTLNLNTLIVTLSCNLSSLGAKGNVGDFDYNPVDGFYYGTLHNSDTLWRYDLAGCTRTAIRMSRTMNGSTGAFWITADGTGYGYENYSGKLLRIDLYTGQILEIGTGDITEQSDGCSCQGIALKKDALVRKIHKGTTQTYEFIITNRYFSNLPNSKVYDQLPAGAIWLSAPYDVSPGLVIGSTTGVNSRTLTVNLNYVPQIQTSFKVDYVVTATYSGAHPMPNQASVINLPIGLGSSIPSDDPTTPAVTDPTMVYFYEHCTNGIDDDVDGSIDCADEDCPKPLPVARVQAN